MVARKRMVLGLLLGLLGSVSTGCSTVNTMLDGKRWDGFPLYAGVVDEWAIIEKIHINVAIGTLAVLDLPFSLALDTLMIPVDLGMWLLATDAPE